MINTTPLPVLMTSMLALLSNEPASCFHNANRFNCRYSRRHQPLLATALAPEPEIGSDGITSGEEKLREEATDALLPVFFPECRRDNISKDDGEHMTQKPITAEVALKRLLRKRYQHRRKDDSHPKETIDASRGRLAKLILGTGVMRLRHWYDVVTTPNKNMRNGTELPPIPYPLDSSLLQSLVLEENSHFTSAGIPSLDQTILDDHNYSIEERRIVRAMVDKHATYLSTADDATPVIKSMHRNDGNINLSIQYSLPLFLTSSLLSYYGYEKTKQICSLMNIPGPITIRKNAIQFSGTDEELCQAMWEEDEIRAEAMVLISEGSQTSCRHVQLIAPTDGNNMYTMRSLSTPGSVMPPEGTIRIHPPLAKSIWSMKTWKHGYFEVQDAGSQLIVQSLEVAPGESILDYCAGNGGKTFALASQLLNTATAAGSNYATNSDDCGSRVVAHDVVEERLRQIKGSLSRVGFDMLPQEERHSTSNHGIVIAQTSHDDGRCTIQLETSSDLVTSHDSVLFDAVLVDAPCSSTGVLRRRPSQRWDITEGQIQELPNLQLEILEKAAAFVNENGGKLVYSTCSLLPEENECVLKKFERSSVFSKQGFEPWEFSPMANNDEAKDGERIQNKYSHTLTLLPSETGCDGFFMARWKRVDKV